MDPSDFEPATPQKIVHAEVERKGIEYIRENFHAHFAPLKIMGYNVRREDVEIREPPDESRR